MLENRKLFTVYNSKGSVKVMAATKWEAIDKVANKYDQDRKGLKTKC